jgi:DNA-binding NarL/FixJ family response regulator
MDGVAGGSMPIRLLVADGCRVFLYGIQAILRDAPDFTLIGSTRDGEAAVHVALSLRPDILLLGIDLESVNGLTAMARVHHADPGIRGVFLTEQAGDRWESLGREAGATAWVSKNVDATVLLNALRDVHAGRRPTGPPTARVESASPGREATLLSPKELAVLRAAVRGLASKDIAAIVGCAPRTVDKHLESVRHKFGVTHPRAIIPIGLVHLRYLDLLADEARESGDGPQSDPPDDAPHPDHPAA